MSVQAISWALEQACATATEKAVLLVVANYVGSDGTTFVGQETIAQRACCSIKTVERTLAVFEDPKRGWIKRERRTRKDGSRTSDLIIWQVQKAPEQRENTLTDTESVRPLPNRQRVRTKQTSCPNLPDTVSGLTTFEPLEEPLEVTTAVAARASANDAGHTEPVVTVVGSVVASAEGVVAEDWPGGQAMDWAQRLVTAAATVRLDVSRQPGLTTTLGRLAAWKRDGASWEHDVLPVVTSLAKRKGTPISTWKFFDAAIAQSIADNRAALTIPEARNAADDTQTANRTNRERSFTGAGGAAALVAARGNF